MSESEKKETIRITFPKLDIPAQVNSTGTGLINIFASDLFDFIDKGLKKQRDKIGLLNCRYKMLAQNKILGIHLYF